MIIASSHLALPGFFFFFFRLTISVYASLSYPSFPMITQALIYSCFVIFSIPLSQASGFIKISI
jgi:hypothetical protein